MFGLKKINELLDPPKCIDCAQRRQVHILRIFLMEKCCSLIRNSAEQCALENCWKGIMLFEPAADIYPYKSLLYCTILSVREKAIPH